MSDWSTIKTRDLQEIEMLASEIRYMNSVEAISKKAAKIKALCTCCHKCNVKPEGHNER